MVIEKTRALAVIPARGGSKRLPRKALLDFLGKPMIAHTVLAAQEAGCFDKILVSSDDDEILDVATRFGATPLKRDPALAEDAVGTAPVLINVLDLESSNGNQWDILACLYATAPLRTSEDIKAVVDLIDPGVCDYAMAVSAADRPVHQALQPAPGGTLTPVWPDLINTNSQDAPQFLFGNGSTYALSVQAFAESKSLYGPGLRGYVMPPERSVDLDTKEDLALLHYYAQNQQENRS